MRLSHTKLLADNDEIFEDIVFWVIFDAVRHDSFWMPPGF